MYPNLYHYLNTALYLNERLSHYKSLHLESLSQQNCYHLIIIQRLDFDPKLC